ncbi:MAG: GspH/FimT family pseudopilin [Candidatus Rokubacteria bacterium]|nr:GspH/FimT family pseudopilin [Candidatus Rokubacteria bacterium]
MGRRVAQAAGFTLLELIVTLFVLALAVGLSAPAIGRSAQAIRARAEVAGFAAVFRRARAEAVTTQRAHAVVVDPAARRVTVVAGADEVRQTRTLSPDMTVVASPPPALSVRFEPQGVSSGGEFHVSSGTIRYRVTIDPLTGRVRNERE